MAWSSRIVFRTAYSQEAANSQECWTWLWDAQWQYWVEYMTHEPDPRDALLDFRFEIDSDGHWVDDFEIA